MVSLAEVAKAAGVGAGTASRALSGRGSVEVSTRRRVEEASKVLGYRGNAATRALRERRSRLVGLLLPDLNNEFYTAAAEVLQREVADAGYQLLVAQTSARLGDEGRAWESMLRSQVDGVVHVPIDVEAPVPTELPVIQLNRRSTGAPTPAVLSKDIAGVRDLTQYVLDQGHRDLRVIVGDARWSTTKDRLTGFRRAIRAAGIPESPASRRPGAPRARVIHADLSIEGGLSGFAPFADAPTVVLAFNTRLLLGVLMSYQLVGLDVPADISVASNGDPEWYGAWSPGITTFSPPLAEMGRLAGREILTLIEQGVDPTAPPRVVRLGGHLIVRESVRRLA